MADPAPVGTPIAVTLLEQHYYDILCNATATAGMCILSAPSVVAATECFVPLGLKPEDQNDVPIIIVNGLSTSLTRTTYMDRHSVQRQYPVKTDQSGTKTFDPNVIPGARPHPNDPNVKLYGAGAYCFQTSSGVYWNDGAMQFAGDDGTPKFALAWSCESGAGYAAVASDLTPYKSDLGTFYDSTVSGNQSVASCSGTDFTVDVATGSVTFMLFNPNPSGNKYDPYDVSFLLVKVRPK